MVCLLAFSACKEDDASPLITADEQIEMERRSSSSVPRHVKLYTSSSAAATEMQLFYGAVIASQDTKYGTRDIDESIWVLEAYANYSWAFENAVIGSVPRDTFNLTLNTNNAGEADVFQLEDAWNDLLVIAQDIDGELGTNEVINAIDLVDGTPI